MNQAWWYRSVILGGGRGICARSPLVTQWACLWGRQCTDKAPPTSMPSLPGHNKLKSLRNRTPRYASPSLSCAVDSSFTAMTKAASVGREIKITSNLKGKKINRAFFSRCLLLSSIQGSCWHCGYRCGFSSSFSSSHQCLDQFMFPNLKMSFRG